MKNAPLVIQVVGDISLDGLFCDPQHHDAVRRNMQEMSDWLGAHNLRIGTLEAPVSGGANPEGKRIRLSTTESALECILPLGLDVALLATNHIGDNGLEGFERTSSFLTKHGIRWLGAGRTTAEAASPIILEKRGVRLGMLNYVGSETNPGIPSGFGVVVNLIQPARVKREVAALKAECDEVMVFLHWGGTEWVRVPSLSQRRLARELVDSGASAVFGSHVHRLQGAEVWRGCPIAYSLGNFLFNPDRIVAQARLGPWPSYCREGAVAELRIGERGKALTWHYFRQPQGGLLLEPDARGRRARSMARLGRLLEAPDSALDRRYRREQLLNLVRIVLANGLIRSARQYAFRLGSWRRLSRLLRPGLGRAAAP